jgi:cell fate (sporulation/competence/biofilm development) regulator YlbF (YheA/YmcA/DUF963 family)
MSKQERKLPVDVQFDYDKLIDMKADQLDNMIKDCEITMERIRGEIVTNYEKAQPYLTQMRLLKQQLKKVSEKMEAAKTFLSMEKNGSLLSGIDLSEMQKNFGDDEETPPPPPLKQSTSQQKFKSPLVMNWANKSKPAITRQKSAPKRSG